MLSMDSGTIIPSTPLKALREGISADSPYVLLADVDISTLEDASRHVKEMGKRTVVHAEMLAGFRPDRIGLMLLRDRYNVDTVISTSTHVLDTARRCGLQTIYRFFLLDSYALRSAFRTLKSARVDGVEMLPGPMAPHVVKAVRETGPDRSILAGGFIRSWSLVDQLWQSGFDGLTTSEQSLWHSRPETSPPPPRAASHKADR